MFPMCQALFNALYVNSLLLSMQLHEVYTVIEWRKLKHSKARTFAKGHTVVWWA